MRGRGEAWTRERLGHPRSPSGGLIRGARAVGSDAVPSAEVPPIVFPPWLIGMTNCQPPGSTLPCGVPITGVWPLRAGLESFECLSRFAGRPANEVGIAGDRSLERRARHPALGLIRLDGALMW